MGARKIEALIRGLPLDSALSRAVDPDRAGMGWRTEHELLASLAELVDTGNRYFAAANSKEGTRIPDPLRVPRPWDKDKAKEPRAQASAKQLKSFIGRTGGHVVTTAQKRKRKNG